MVDTVIMAKPGDTVVGIGKTWLHHGLYWRNVTKRWLILAKFYDKWGDIGKRDNTIADIGKNWRYSRRYWQNSTIIGYWQNLTQRSILVNLTTQGLILANLNYTTVVNAGKTRRYSGWYWWNLTMEWLVFAKLDDTKVDIGKTRRYSGWYRQLDDTIKIGRAWGLLG